MGRLPRQAKHEPSQGEYQAVTFLAAALVTFLGQTQASPALVVVELFTSEG